jgi:hypothetical protein
VIKLLPSSPTAKSWTPGLASVGQQHLATASPSGGAGHLRNADMIICSRPSLEQIQAARHCGRVSSGTHCAGLDLPSTVPPNASTKACAEMGPAHRSSSEPVVQCSQTRQPFYFKVIKSKGGAPGTTYQRGRGRPERCRCPRDRSWFPSTPHREIGRQSCAAPGSRITLARPPFARAPNR